jgi:MFS family permease
MSSAPTRTFGSLLAFGLLAAGSVLGLAGVDLVLPAIPTLPESLGGDEAAAQLVIAAYVAGTAVGLWAFGAWGGLARRQLVLIGALAAFAVLSLVAAAASDMTTLIVLRFLQGAAGAAPAVFAPGVIRAHFSEHNATVAVGAPGSLESLSPALAPIIGLWLMSLGGWESSFIVTGVIAALLAVCVALSAKLIPSAAPPKGGSYVALLKSPVFLRYALSYAFAVGGLLIFVFGAPAVIVRTLDGAIESFIAMQVVGVAIFITASSLTGVFVRRFGAEPMIFWGSLLSAAAALALLLYAALGGAEPLMLIALFAPINLGIGLRGPPGFLRAVIAGAGDDDRAASLTVLALMGISAAGAAITAPFIAQGLPALALAAFVAHLAGVALLVLLPKLAEPSAAAAR